MPNFGIGKLNSDDTHSINVSYYKPEGISLLWSWFKKINNSGNASKSIFSQSNNIKLKLNADDLNKLKNNGIDLVKLQNKGNSKNPLPRGNIFVIPKHHLGVKEKELLNMIPNFIKGKDTVSKNKKAFDRLVVATSTVSVKSKQSLVSSNFKYVRSINSHKSLTNSSTSTKASFRVGVKSNTNFDTQAKRFHKNILLKSVPTKILKGNTQRKVFIPIYVGRKRTENRENLTNLVQDAEEGCVKSDTNNVIPMLLKKIKSMEEQISDIEVTTNKINEAVSQQRILQTNGMANKKMGKNERNVDFVKNVVSHKVYSKNTHHSKKSKLKQQKKPKPQIKINPNTMFLNCNTSNHNDSRLMNPLLPPHPLFKKEIEYENKAYSNNEHMFDLSQQQIKYQSKIHETLSNAVNNNCYGSPEIRCDIMLKLLKALSETKNQNSDTENLQETPKSLNNDNHAGNSNELMDIKLESKPTFNWKHKSLSSASETQFTNHKIKAKESIRHEIKQHLSVPLKTDMNCPMRKSQTLNNFDHSEDNENVKSDLINKNSKDNEQLLNLKAKSQQVVNHSIDILNSEENIYTVRDTRNNSSKNITSLISETPTSKRSLSIHNEVNSHQKDLMNENLEYDLKTRRSEFSLAEENHILHTSMVRHDMYKNIIKDSKDKLNHVSPPENIVTNILKNKVKKEPKVSITILVEDGMKDRVKMTTNLLNENELANKIECKDNTVVRGDGDHKGNIIESNKASEYVRENIHKVEYMTDDNTPFGFNSTENNEVINRSSPKEVVFSQTNKINEVGNYNLINENGYLNQKQRKQYEKKLLEVKVDNNKLLFSHIGQKETNSCMDLTYNSELPVSRNENESFLMGQSSICASVKRSILCNESIFSTADKSFVRKRRGPWSLESSKSHNNLDVSSNFFNNDQSDSYNFNKPSSKEERQPFVIIHNKQNEADCFKNSNQRGLDQKRRSCRYGISIIREPIPEDLEKEVAIKETDHTDLQQLQEGDNIKVQADIYNSKLSDDLDIIEGEVRGADSEVVKDSNLTELPMVTSNYDNSTLIKSSVSVQTDWSLIGITIDHFNSDTLAKSVSTNTVSIQTDDLEPIIKDLDLPRLCQSCFNSSAKSSETASFNRTSHQEDSIEIISDRNIISSEFNKENVMELKMSSVLITVLKDGEQLEKHNECKNYNMNIEENCPKLKTEKNQISEGKIGQLNGSLEFLNYELQRDFSVHRCTIPCFPSLSDETVLSDISESNYKGLLSANLISDFHSAFSKMQHLNEKEINHNVEQDGKVNQIVPVNEVEDLYHNDEKNISEATVESLPSVKHKQASLTENVSVHANLTANGSIQVISDRVNLIQPRETTKNTNHLDKKPCFIKMPSTDMIKSEDLCYNSSKPATPRDLHPYNRVTAKKSTKDFVVGVYNFECENVRRGNSIFTNIADSYPLNTSKTQTHIW